MKKIRHTESQIIGILKEQEQGLKVTEICRKHNIADQTFYILEETLWRNASRRAQAIKGFGIRKCAVKKCMPT
nr:transposase [Bacteroidota bacterium]